MNRYEISFEFFPPKTELGEQKLQNTAAILACFEPSFFSVTFGAGGSTKSKTKKTACMLTDLIHKKNFDKTKALCVAPHISCVGAAREEVSSIVEEYKSLGFKRIVALRGDLPSGMGGSIGELSYANELVTLIRKTWGDYFHIHVAAYPEMHPQSDNANNDVINFERKVKAGASSAITQYFYNKDAYFRFVEHCDKKGINIPIVPGIMPIGNFDKLKRFSNFCGAEIPRWLYKRLEAYDDEESLRKFGIDVVTTLCEELLKGGAPGLHFYTLNQVEPTTSIIKNLNRLILKKTEEYKKCVEF